MIKDRASTILELAHSAAIFYRNPQPDAALLAQHVTPDVLPALRELNEKFSGISWDKSAISAAIKETLVNHQLKMPKLAMPVRLLVTGETQTPAIDATLALFDQTTVVSRMDSILTRM